MEKLENRQALGKILSNPTEPMKTLKKPRSKTTKAADPKPEFEVQSLDPFDRLQAAVLQGRRKNEEAEEGRRRIESWHAFKTP